MVVLLAIPGLRDLLLSHLGSGRRRLMLLLLLLLLLFVAHAHADPAAGHESGGTEHARRRHGVDRLRRRRGRLHDVDGKRGSPLNRMVLQRVLLQVRARRRRRGGGRERAAGAPDLLQKGDESGDAEDLGGDSVMS